MSGDGGELWIGLSGPAGSSSAATASSSPHEALNGHTGTAADLGRGGALLARCAGPDEALRYILTIVDRDFAVDEFPVGIIGLQVAEHGDDARVVTVQGEVDTLTAPKLANFLTAQLSAAQVVVVDLDGVEFLGSAGLSALFEANELAAREHRALRLVCHSRIVNRALDATELRGHFIFADTVPEALKDPL